MPHKLSPMASAPQDRPILVSFHAGRGGPVVEAEVIWSADYRGFIPTALIASLLYPGECIGWRDSGAVNVAVAA